MYTFKVQNEKNEIYNITESSYHRILSINGLSPAAAQISTTDAVGYDGSIYTYGRCGQRNITLQLAMIGNIEESRQKLYSFFIPQKTVKLFFKNANRDVYIDGFIESADIDLFSQMQVADISIICPEPYFIANEEAEHTLVKDSDDKFSATVSGGEISGGAEINIEFLPSGYIYAPVPIIIENTTTGSMMTVDHSFMPNEGTVYINTTPGSKQAYYNYNGKTNIISDIRVSGGWLNIVPGENEIKVYNQYTTSRQTYKVTVTARKYYIGV